MLIEGGPPGFLLCFVETPVGHNNRTPLWDLALGLTTPMPQETSMFWDCLNARLQNILCFWLECEHPPLPPDHWIEPIAGGGWVGWGSDCRTISESYIYVIMKCMWYVVTAKLTNYFLADPFLHSPTSLLLWLAMRRSSSIFELCMLNIWLYRCFSNWAKQARARAYLSGGFLFTTINGWQDTSAVHPGGEWHTSTCVKDCWKNSK